MTNKPMFKLTWGWGQSKTFHSRNQMMKFIENNEEELKSIFGLKEYIRGSDDNWYPLGEE